MKKDPSENRSVHRRGQSNRALSDNFTQWIWDQVAPYIGHRVLEVGCGRATLVSHIAESANRYLGLDRARDVIEINRRRYSERSEKVNFVVGDLSTDDFPHPVRTFDPDTILCLNVLEHLKNDREVVLRLKNLLSEQGWLIIQVPAHPWLYGSNDEAVGHFRRYSHQELRQILELPGIDEVQIKPFNFTGILPWWIQGQIFRQQSGYFESLSGPSLTLLNYLFPVIQQVESLLPLAWGLSWFGLARRSSGLPENPTPLSTTRFRDRRP